MRLALCTLAFFALSITSFAETDAKSKSLMARIKRYEAQIKNVDKDVKKTDKALTQLQKQLNELNKKEQILRKNLRKNIHTFNAATRDILRLSRQNISAQRLKSVMSHQPNRTGILKQGEKALTKNINTNKDQLKNLLKLYETTENLQQRRQDIRRNLTAKRTRIVALRRKYLKELKVHDETLAKNLNHNIGTLPRAPKPVQRPQYTHKKRIKTPNYPVDGKIIRKWGQQDKSGVPARGLTFRSEALASVRSMTSGRVLYSGTFRDYGNLVIIEPKAGTHAVYGGLGHAVRKVGDTLKKGDVIGTLPSNDAPELYFEIRKRGKEINPQKWLK